MSFDSVPLQQSDRSINQVGYHQVTWKDSLVASATPERPVS